MLVKESFSHQDVTGFKFGYMAMGKPSMFSHVYYVDGLLIDTGHSRVEKHVLDQTRLLSVNQLFITHHHEDHTGNLPAVMKQHNCPAYASTLCCETMKAPPPISFAQKLTWGTRPPSNDLVPVDDVLNTENYSFQLIHIPGHAHDMYALYEPNQQWLFSADLYINSYIGYFLKTESIAQQISSTKKVLELDFDVMFCAHNPQLKNGKAKLKKKLGFLESSFEKVAHLYEKGLDAKAIFKALKLKENKFVKLLSGGHLSQLNMVKSVIRDIEEGNENLLVKKTNKG